MFKDTPNWLIKVFEVLLYAILLASSLCVLAIISVFFWEVLHWGGIF